MCCVDAMSGLKEFATCMIEIVVVLMGSQDNVDGHDLLLGECGAVGLGETGALSVSVVAGWVKSRVSQYSQASDFDDGGRSANESNFERIFGFGHMTNLRQAREFNVNGVTSKFRPVNNAGEAKGLQPR